MWLKQSTKCVRYLKKLKIEYFSVKRLYHNRNAISFCQGEFRWLFRKRIRIELIGEKIYDPPIELHDQQLQHPEYRFMDCLQELQHQSNLSKDLSTNRRVLPVRALNEVT